MNKSKCLLASFLISFPVVFTLQAQEVITPLYKNPRAAQHYNAVRSVKKSTKATLLELPIFDDFSNNSYAPDSSIWSDAFAFVNNNFAIDPVTNGVATLDALDASGSIYPNATLSPHTFEADHLTSQPINLVYPASDSIYLSFLYQPGGLCNVPDDQDSLLVDFYATDSSQWINVWKIPGTGLQDFKHVMIPITSDRYLTSGFRFRFRNLASLPQNNDMPDKRSNVDYWHLDYIRLDRNRTSADTILRDVAFNTPISSMFKELTAVPWSHFQQASNTAIASSVFAGYRNNDSISRNVTRSLTILEPYYGESEPAGIPTAMDIPAFETSSVEFPLIYDLDYQRGDSALVRFKAAIRTDEFDPKVNDTVVHDQFFRDYYAYDDGTAEAGYGLRGDGTAYGKVAIRHRSYKPDMLGGVYIYFNQVYDSVNLKDYTFNLMVWNDAGGIPGTVIWDDETIYRPRYTPDYTGFVKYEFTEPVPVSGTFYVGWRQYKEFILNVGLDLNTVPSAPVMLYNVGEWMDSEAPGMLLFRPYFYDSNSGTGYRSAPEISPLTCYPNPATERIWFNIPTEYTGEDILIYIYDTSGRELHRSVLRTNNLDVSGFSPGLYYIRARIDGKSYYSKILINH